MALAYNVAMAIFGKLSDMAFADLMAMLGRRGGVLRIFNLPDQKLGYAIGLDGGQIIWLREGTRLLEPVEARQALKLLLRAEQGVFEFSPSAVADVEGYTLRWPLERLFVSMTQELDEREAYRPYLPNPKTRFKAVALEVWLDETLWTFWEQAKAPLARGASVEELASALNLPIDDVAFYLHKLRLVGKVSPVRAFEAQAPDSQQQSLFRRLLNSLTGRRS